MYISSWLVPHGVILIWRYIKPLSNNNNNNIKENNLKIINELLIKNPKKCFSLKMLSKLILGINMKYKKKTITL